MIPPLTLTVAALAGLVAGTVNAIAGGGSFLLLPTLIIGGLSPSVANGTMRLGVVVQTLASTLTFARRGMGQWRIVTRLLPPTCVGALAGAAVATRISGAVLRPIFGWLLLAWAAVLLWRPGRFLRTAGTIERPRAPTYLLLLAIGGYGGFVQAGVGFPLIALLVMHLGYPAVRANAIKVALILGYTMVTIPVFVDAGQVAWLEGAALSLGTMIGGWAGVRLQLKVGVRLVHWVLLVMLIVGGAALALG